MNYEAILKFRNEMNPFARMLNIDAVELRQGYAKASMPVGKELLNPQGAASYGEWIATLDADFHYLRPGLNLTSLTAEAVELKHGKRVSVYDVKVSDQNGTVLAAGTFTFSSLGRKIELSDGEKVE